MYSGLLHAEHHTCRQAIYLPVWRSRLDLVSAPGQRSSACPKTRPHSDTLKQSRLIQQSISSLRFLPSRYLSQPPLLCLNKLLHYHCNYIHCDNVLSASQHSVDSQDTSRQVNIFPKMKECKWRWNLSFNEKSITSQWSNQFYMITDTTSTFR